MVNRSDSISCVAQTKRVHGYRVGGHCAVVPSQVTTNTTWLAHDYLHLKIPTNTRYRATLCVTIGYCLLDLVLGMYGCGAG